MKAANTFYCARPAQMSRGGGGGGDNTHTGAMKNVLGICRNTSRLTEASAKKKGREGWRKRKKNKKDITALAARNFLIVLKTELRGIQSQCAETH